FAHFFRTGSRVTALFGIGALSGMMLVDRALWMTGLVPLGLLLAGWLLTRDLSVSRIRQAAQRGKDDPGVRAASLSSLRRQNYQADFGSQFARLAGTFRWFFGMEFESGGDEQRVPKVREDRDSGLFRVLAVDFLAWIYARRR